MGKTWRRPGEEGWAGMLQLQRVSEQGKVKLAQGEGVHMQPQKCPGKAA